MKTINARSGVLLPLFLLMGSLLSAQLAFTPAADRLSGTSFSFFPVGIEDVNGDGLDDLVRLQNGVALWVDYQRPGRTQLEAQAIEAFDAPVEPQWALSLADYDKDGARDLLIAGARDDVKLLRQVSSERFELGPRLVAPDLFAQNVNWVDIDNDGWVDAFVCHDLGESRIWSNQADGTFATADQWIDMSSDPPSDKSGNYGSIWTDFDNDGDLDLILLHHFEIPREFHQNQGDGRFELLTNEWTASEEGFAWSLSAVDFDADGDLDICQSNRFRTGGGILHNFLFRNTTEDCRSALVVSLQGIASNPQGDGAQVRVYGQNPAGQSALQMRELSCLSGGGYTTQSGTRLHFGLGDWSIDSLVVDWPSGAHLRYEDLPWYDRHLLLREDGGWAELDDFKRLRIRATRRPDCPGTINELWARHFTAPLEWFQLDVFGAETLVGEGERLAVPLVRGELVYVAEDVCGQRDTFSVNHGEHLESKIFPNPTTGLCQLVLAAPPGQDQAQVRIYDTTGRLMDDLILSLEAGFVRQQLDLRHYAAGTYLVQIEGPCWQSLEKIVVMQL